MKQKSKTKLRVLTILAATVLTGFWLYALVDNNRSTKLDTVPKLTEEIRSKLQDQLKKKNCEIGTFVEGAHRTVKPRSFEIVKCAVVTADGGEKIKNDLSNITHVDIAIRVKWYDTWLSREGESEVHYRLVPRDGKLHPTPFKIAKTSASYTRADCK